MIGRLRLAAAAALAAAMLAFGGQAGAMPPAGTYTYTVRHPDHGEIGTYTNTIRREGDAIVVDTKVRIQVKVAFVSVFRLEADRREEWRNGRLQAYSSVTRKNGDEIRVTGRAEGDKFVINGPSGQITAPADVVPTNPWSIDMTKADTVMASESGRIFDARLAGREETTVTVGDQQVPARHFQVVADTRHDLWFDPEGRVVQFATRDDGKTISFILRR